MWRWLLWLLRRWCHDDHHIIIVVIEKVVIVLLLLVVEVGMQAGGHGPWFTSARGGSGSGSERRNDRRLVCASSVTEHKTKLGALLLLLRLDERAVYSLIGCERPRERSE